MAAAPALTRHQAHCQKTGSRRCVIDLSDVALVESSREGLGSRRVGLDQIEADRPLWFRRTLCRHRQSRGRSDPQLGQSVRLDPMKMR